MKNKKRIMYAVSGIILAGAAYFIFVGTGKKEASSTEIKPIYGDVEVTVSATGTVKPQNRLEIKPPINGRVEKIFVREGEKVKKGDTLALMSSTERAALLDAAHSQGKDAVEYWEKVYMATPLIAPINGEVIVRNVEPGQTVTSGDAVLVLSDRLIVQAEVDETDIGRVKIGLNAEVTLDAYPNVKIKSKVDHVSYESTVINNVTVYQVDILPYEIPDFYRSGMSAEVTILEEQRKNVLLIPMEAVSYDGSGGFVYIKDGKSGKVTRRDLKLGINDDARIEVVSGLTSGDTVVVSGNGKLYSKETTVKTSPFMPFGGRPKAKKN